MLDIFMLFKASYLCYPLHRLLSCRGEGGLDNSEKLWAMLCRDTQDGQVLVESSTWGRNWQAAPVSLPRKPHEQKQKAKKYDAGG